MATALRNFLHRYQVHGKDTICTHTDYRNGKFYVLVEDEDEFYRAYKESYVAWKPQLTNGNPVPASSSFFIVERPRDVGPLLIDLDLRGDPATWEEGTRLIDGDLAPRFLQAFVAQAAAYVDLAGARFFVLAKPAARIEKDKVKDGIHIVCPDIVLPWRVQRAIREATLPHVAALLAEYTINTPDDCVDVAVLGTGGWFMYGSSKRDHHTHECHPPYLVTNIYRVSTEPTAPGGTAALQEIPLMAHEDYIELLSIRNKFKETELLPTAPPIPEEPARKPRKQPPATDPAAPSGSTKEIPRNSGNPADKAATAAVPYAVLHAAVMFLTDKYYANNTYNAWIRVLWAILHTAHANGYEDLGAELCHEFSMQGGTAYEEYSVDRIIDSYDPSETDPVTFGSIMHWVFLSYLEKLVGVIPCDERSRIECIVLALANLYREHNDCAEIKAVWANDCKGAHAAWDAALSQPHRQLYGLQDIFAAAAAYDSEECADIKKKWHRCRPLPPPKPADAADPDAASQPPEENPGSPDVADDGATQQQSGITYDALEKVVMSLSPKYVGGEHPDNHARVFFGIIHTAKANGYPREGLELCRMFKEHDGGAAYTKHTADEMFKWRCRDGNRSRPATFASIRQVVTLDAADAMASLIPDDVFHADDRVVLSLAGMFESTPSANAQAYKEIFASRGGAPAAWDDAMKRKSRRNHGVDTIFEVAQAFAPDRCRALMDILDLCKEPPPPPSLHDPAVVFDEDYDEPRMRPYDTHAHPVMLVVGGMGAGKTEAAVDTVQKEPASSSILIISTSIALSRQCTKKFAGLGFRFYLDEEPAPPPPPPVDGDDADPYACYVPPPQQAPAKKKKDYIIKDRRVICNINSLYRVDLTSFDLVIVDEPLSLLGLLNSDRLGRKQDVFESFQELMLNSHRLVFMDANADNQLMINFTQQLYKDRCALGHTAKPYWVRSRFVRINSDPASGCRTGPERITMIVTKARDKATRVKCFTSGIDKLMEFLDQGLRVVVACSTKKVVAEINKRWEEHFKGREAPAAMFYTSTTSATDAATLQQHMDNVNHWWRKFQLVVYSPTISAGISFTEVHFDVRMAFFTNSFHTPPVDVSMQQLYRVRPTTSNSAFIYVDAAIQACAAGIPQTMQGVQRALEREDNYLKLIKLSPAAGIKVRPGRGAPLMYITDNLSYCILTGNLVNFGHSIHQYAEIMEHELRTQRGAEVQVVEFVPEDEVDAFLSSSASPHDAGMIGDVSPLLHDGAPDQPTTNVPPSSASTATPSDATVAASSPPTSIDATQSPSSSIDATQSPSSVASIPTAATSTSPLATTATTTSADTKPTKPKIESFVVPLPGSQEMAELTQAERAARDGTGPPLTLEHKQQLFNIKVADTVYGIDLQHAAAHPKELQDFVAQCVAPVGDREAMVKVKQTVAGFKRFQHLVLAGKLQAVRDLNQGFLQQCIDENAGGRGILPFFKSWQKQDHKRAVEACDMLAAILPDVDVVRALNTPPHEVQAVSTAVYDNLTAYLRNLPKNRYQEIVQMFGLDRKSYKGLPEGKQRINFISKVLSVAFKLDVYVRVRDELFISAAKFFTLTTVLKSKWLRIVDDDMSDDDCFDV